MKIKPTEIKRQQNQNQNQNQNQHSKTSGNLGKEQRLGVLLDLDLDLELGFDQVEKTRFGQGASSTASSTAPAAPQSFILAVQALGPIRQAPVLYHPPPPFPLQRWENIQTLFMLL